MTHDVFRGDANGAAHDTIANRPVLRTLLRMLIAPAIGAAAGLLLLVTVILPAVGLGDVQRIAALGQHLDQELHPRPVAVFLGNSITREGIDSAQVEAAAGGPWHVENLALSGCSVLESRILLPKLMRARPDVVVLPFHPRDLGWIDDLPLDKSYAYAVGGFIEAWPADWTRDSLPGLGQASYDALRSSWLEQQVHFRTAPLNALNDAIRRVSRRNTLRSIQAYNWSDPYELTRSVSGARLEDHAGRTRREIQAALRDGIADGANGIRRLARDSSRRRHARARRLAVASLAARGVRLGSSHPAVQRRASVAALGNGCAEPGPVRRRLGLARARRLRRRAAPQRPGTRKYSRFMGQQLRDVPSTPGGTP